MDPDLYNMRKPFWVYHIQGNDLNTSDIDNLLTMELITETIRI